MHACPTLMFSFVVFGLVSLVQGGGSEGQTMKGSAQESEKDPLVDSASADCPDFLDWVLLRALPASSRNLRLCC